MADESGFPLVSDWPDEPAWHTCRFNSSYLSEVTGALLDYAYGPLWQGTSSEQETMVKKINLLVEQIATPYECPAGETTMDVVQAIYTLPSGTQTGSALTQSVYNQLKFDSLLIDTTTEASIESPGGVVVPSGLWLLDLRYHLFYATVYMPIKIIHDGTDIVFADFLQNYATPLSIACAVQSDGENPIEAWVNPSTGAVYFGYGTVYNLDRIVGTLTLQRVSD